METDPWDYIGEHYPVDTPVKVKVSKITDFGVFVELPEGVEGLIKKNDMTSDLTVNIGDELDVKVVKVEPQNRKINFILSNG
jgi:small subunit ribosomal protein S1